MTTRRRDRLLLAGSTESLEPPVRAALDTLRGEGVEIECLACDGADAAVEAVRRAREEDWALVAVGGDGALNTTVNALFRARASEDVVLGVLPAGTANDFAGQLGLAPDDPEGALRLACSGRATRIDVGRANGRAFANVASGGYGARITTETPPVLKNFLGALAYSVSGMMMATRREPLQMRMTADDFEWEGNVSLFCVGNGTQTGGGFRVCPQASLTDGMLDLLIIPDLPMDQLALIVADIVQGRSVGHEDVVYVQTPWVDVSAGEEFQVNLDGEPMHAESVFFDVAHEGLTFVMP